MGALYQMAASNYDLCFTRDAEFSRRVLSKPAARLKLVHIIIPQTRQDEFVQQFLTAFREQLGQVIKTVTIGPLNSAGEKRTQIVAGLHSHADFCLQLNTAATT
jgi:hypothetical protein